MWVQTRCKENAFIPVSIHIRITKNNNIDIERQIYFCSVCNIKAFALKFGKDFFGLEIYLQIHSLLLLESVRHLLY